MSKKVFKTLDEQVDILRNKGLIINNEQKTKEILLKENYFFINGYRHLFLKKKNQFIEGTTFEELYGMFKFDRNMRNIFFKNLLIIENNVKSIISYSLSKQYGFKEKDYLNIDNFTSDTIKIRQVKDVLNKVSRQIRVNGSQHTATMHYITNYGYIPLWILVKVVSFGLISEFYDIFKHQDRQTIADFYNMSAEELSIYLHILSNYRNLCAHEDVLYDHKSQKTIPDCKYHELLKITKNEDGYVSGKDDLFAVIIIFKQMLSDSEFRELVNEIGYEIDVLEAKTEIIPINYLLEKMGFPDNWREIIEL